MTESLVPDLPEDLTAKNMSQNINNYIVEKVNLIMERLKSKITENNAGFILKLHDLITFEPMSGSDIIARNIIFDKLSKAGYEIVTACGETEVDILVLNPYVINYRILSDYLA